MLDLELVQLVQPVTGVIVVKLAFDGRVIDVHHRHLAVAGLGAGGTLADLLEDGDGALDVVADADGVAELGAHALIGGMDLVAILSRVGVDDTRGHVLFPLVGAVGRAGAPFPVLAGCRPDHPAAVRADQGRRAAQIGRFSVRRTQLWC